MQVHFLETNIAIDSSVTVQVLNWLYLFGTAFPRPDGQSLAIVFGGNEGQINSGQKARVVELSSASNISYAVSSVSGKYNQVTVSNNTGYSIRFCILTLGNVRPSII